MLLYIIRKHISCNLLIVSATRRRRDIKYRWVCRPPETPFFVQKIKIVSLSLNLTPRPIRICKIQWLCSLFLFYTKNNPFWANLIQKLKIFRLSWNLVPRPAQICRIQWCCSFSVFERKYPFWVYLAQKFKIVSLSWNLVHRLIRGNKVCRVQWWCSLFLFFTGNNPFLANLVQKFETVSLHWNFQ